MIKMNKFPPFFWKKVICYALSGWVAIFAPLLSQAFAEDHYNPRKSKWGFKSRSHSEKNEERNDDNDEVNPEGMVDLVDIPATNVIDYGGFRVNFRFYKNGGLLNHLSFGVFRRLNLGASWDVEKFIGVEDPSTNVPTLNIKLRAYDGGNILPSLAIGYDGQGRFFDKNTDLYKERERGLFAAFGREVFLPNLEAIGGINIAKFKEGTVLGFLGAAYMIENRFALMLEYDNIRSGPENRLNAGFRIFPLSSLGIDFAVRDLTNPGNRERVVRINYVGSF